MYRVGRQCFETLQSATDYQMSLVVPIITADGTLVHPVKQGEVWTYAGRPVNLSFGHCNPTEDLQAGMQIAGAFITLMAVAFCFRFLAKFISKMGENAVSERDN